MNVIQRFLDRLRHSGETPEQRAYRRYRATLDGRPAPIYASSTQLTRLTHVPCGTDHLPWEACPVAPPRIVGAQLRHVPVPPRDREVS